MSKEGSRCAPLFLLLRLEVPCWLLDIQSFALVCKQAHAYDPVPALNRLYLAVSFNIQYPTRNTQCPRAAVAALRCFYFFGWIFLVEYWIFRFLAGLPTGSCA